MEILESENICGRVLKWDSANLVGDAELALGVAKSDLVSFQDQFGNKAVCRIESVLLGGPASGLKGKIKLLGREVAAPKPLAPLYYYTPEVVRGALIELGANEKNESLKVRLNTFFDHTLIIGKTRSGKTQFEIAISEQLCERKVPHLIIDPQGEFVNLSKFDRSVVIVKKPNENVLPALKQKRTVVLDLLDLSDDEKRTCCYDALALIIREKERTYANAENKSNDFPPMLVTIDEVDIFTCGKIASKPKARSREIITDIVKRRAKFGIGATLIVQRMNSLPSDIKSQCHNAAVFNLTEVNDLHSVKVFGAQRAPLNALQILKKGEACVIGGWVEYPHVIKARSIKTARTKSLDFEAMLGLEVEEYKESNLHQQGRSEENQSYDHGEEEANALCSACKVHCVKTTGRAHGTVPYPHPHWRCPSCNDEYCIAEDKWIT